MADIFDAPIPGQSLTTDPNNPLPFETSPEFTDKDRVMRGLFEKMMEPDSISRISRLLNEGVSVESLTKVILFSGMSSGKINVDMQMLMIEPVVYMILFIAERLGVEPAFKDEEFLDVSVEDEIGDILNMGQEDVENIKEKIPTSLLSKIEEEISSG